MILDCPKCHARFLVADHLIPRDGRIVRCGACAHQWHVNPLIHIAEALSELPLEKEEPSFTVDVEEEEYEPELKPLPRGSNVPAITKRKWPVKPFKIAVPALALLWLVVAFIAYFPSWSNAPVLSSIYSLFGVTNTQGLAFADVHMEREENDSKTRFIFTGNIVNHATVERKVPIVHIALNDKDGNAVWGRDYPVNVELKAGEVYPFRIQNVETSFGANVATMILDLGNSFELMVR